jgi:TRAP-type transport system small permease protein
MNKPTLKVPTEANIAAFLMALMLVMMAYQIVTRYIFDSPSEWTEEVMRYTYVWIVFLGSSAAIADKSHVAITLLSEKLSVRQRSVLEIALDSLLIVYFFILFYVGCRATLVNMKINLSVLDYIPYAAVYVVIPLTCITMILRTFVNLRRSVRTLKSGVEFETHARAIV